MRTKQKLLRKEEERATLREKKLSTLTTKAPEATTHPIRQKAATYAAKATPKATPPPKPATYAAKATSKAATYATKATSKAATPKATIQTPGSTDSSPKATKAGKRRCQAAKATRDPTTHSSTYLHLLQEVLQLRERTKDPCPESTQADVGDT